MRSNVPAVNRTTVTASRRGFGTLSVVTDIGSSVKSLLPNATSDRAQSLMRHLGCDATQHCASYPDHGTSRSSAWRFRPMHRTVDA